MNEDTLIIPDSPDDEPRDTDVLLISMPFGPLVSPSIGLGLLQASLNQSPYTARSIYFTLDFARLIEPALYIRISDGHPKTYVLLGEWIFSTVLNRASSEEVQAYIESVLKPELESWLEGADDGPFGTPRTFLDAIIGLPEIVQGFLDQCLARVLEHRPKVVGFTSVFQQHIASLCLARMIKRSAPETKIVFGGANCEGEMGRELLRQFRFVDVVVSGEGDLVINELVRSLIEDGCAPEIDGIHTRGSVASGSDAQETFNTPVVRTMDVLPYPYYEDYFRQLYRFFSRDQLPFTPTVPFETSRGCWWGEIKHCTFCGLNGETMQFRSKSSDRAMSELRWLASLYPGMTVAVVDNILDMGYFKSFIPALAEADLDVQLFYETKANLKKEQILALKRAGIVAIQPGVESLSTDVLRLMRKGVTAIQNIQLLKWCKELGVTPYWNVLWGFPNEPVSEYRRIAGEIWKFTHLHPPTAYASIRLDRFSPNFNTPAAFGFRNVKPYPCYSHIYRKCSDQARANLAYFFTFDYEDDRDVDAYVLDARKKIDRWRREYESSDLFYVDKGESLLVWDFRHGSTRPLYVLTRNYRTLYLACDGIRSESQLQHMMPDLFPDIKWSTVLHMLGELTDAGLMMREEDRYLSLAVATTGYTPSRAVLERLVAVSRSLGTQGKEEVRVSLAENAQQTHVFE